MTDKIFRYYVIFILCLITVNVSQSMATTLTSGFLIIVNLMYYLKKEKNNDK